jgi:hypothetical protein
MSEKDDKFNGEFTQTGHKEVTDADLALLEKVSKVEIAGQKGGIQ